MASSFGDKFSEGLLTFSKYDANGSLKKETIIWSVLFYLVIIIPLIVTSGIYVNDKSISFGDHYAKGELAGFTSLLSIFYIYSLFQLVKIIEKQGSTISVEEKSISYIIPIFSVLAAIFGIATSGILLYRKSEPGIIWGLIMYLSWSVLGYMMPTLVHTIKPGIFHAVPNQTDSKRQLLTFGILIIIGFVFVLYFLIYGLTEKRPDGERYIPAKWSVSVGATVAAITSVLVYLRTTKIFRDRSPVSEIVVPLILVGWGLFGLISSSFLLDGKEENGILWSMVSYISSLAFSLFLGNLIYKATSLSRNPGTRTNLFPRTKDFISIQTIIFGVVSLAYGIYLFAYGYTEKKKGIDELYISESETVPIGTILLLLGIAGCVFGSLFLTRIIEVPGFKY